MSKPKKSATRRPARTPVAAAPSRRGNERRVPDVRDKPGEGGRVEDVYAFDLGDSHKHCIGAVIHVHAANLDEALERAREAADLFLDGSTVLRSGGSNYRWLDLIRVYMDGTRLKRTNVRLD